MTTVKIEKRRIVAPIDFGRLFDEKSVCGVKLTYKEYGFIQLGEKDLVMFDAFSSAHKYKPFKAECGAVAFPFYFGCMTDDGERVVYAGVRFGESSAERWELLGKDEALGLLTVDPDAASIPIASGVCCFADSKAYAEYCAHLSDELSPLSGHIVIKGQTHTVAELYGNKYAVFSTGWGSGRFRCYVGYDADGAATAVIADFGMIDYPDDRSVVEIQVDETALGQYVYDPEKSESENNIARWTHALRLAVDSAEKLNAYARRGYAYHSIGDTDAALDDYNAAIACIKEISDAYSRRRVWSVYDNATEIYCERGDYQSAISLMTDALDNNNDNLNTGMYVRLIDLYLRVSRADKALETAERMLALRSDDPVAYVKYAECCVAVTDYRSAARAYRTLATDFKLFENFFDCAACLIEIGEYDEARSALESHPAKESYEQYWYYKAYIDYKTGSCMSAVHNATRAVDIDKEYLPALYLIIDALSVLHEYYDVARYAEEYKKIRPDNEYGYCVCAEAHLILGNFSECAKNYYYLYDKIKHDDKYAAIGALACLACGDNKRFKRLFKKLKKTRSPYGYCVLFGLYSNNYVRRVRNMSFERIADRLAVADDFLLLLSMYLLRTGNARYAAQVLEAYNKSGCASYDSMALQLSVCERLGDKQAFLVLFDSYVKTFVAGDMTENDKRALALRLMDRIKPHKEWLGDIK